MRCIKMIFGVILALLVIVVTPPTVQACGTVVGKAFLPEVRGEMGLPPQDERGRGCHIDKDFIFRLLVPKGKTGHTLEEKPTLYWFVSKPVNARFVFTLEEYLPPGSREEGEVLINNATFKHTVTKAGIYPLAYSFHGSLTPEKEYRMALSLKCGNSRSSTREITVDGTIKRKNKPIRLKNCIRRNQKSPTNLYNVYQDNYLWYDALNTIQTISNSHSRHQLLQNFLLESRPNDREFHTALQRVLR